MWCIYKHTNKINGKVYIGQTCEVENPNKRWKNGEGYSVAYPFGRAISKYGWDNFTHEIIETNIDTLENANEREIYWIDYYHSYIKDPKCNGYNATKGGNNGAHLGQIIYQLNGIGEIINQFESASEAERQTSICGRNILACCNDEGQISAGGFYWCYKNKFDTWECPKKHPYSRAVICIETKEIFESLRTAALKYNIHESGIQAVCGKKTQYTAAGKHWCYLEDYEAYQLPTAQPRKLSNREKNNSERPIYQIGLDQQLIRAFQSIKEAAQILFPQIQYADKSIKKCCVYKQISAYSYYWCYQDEYDNWKPLQPKVGNKYKVICVETGQIYDSMKQAAQATNTAYTSISQCCNGKAKTAGGFHWKIHREGGGE